ncbi:alpha carbonic anhydrase 1, chloroplastic [Vitis riparia]|uniref:alpha carbonic anhydrase 1, chloroplastic n=1 Tax=Vitis riparia TaxID=96939 RepID=UPI00155AE62C|nr:alpha carbonic anhydrase 1, chloroplastic [Vitis riparia]
MRLAMAAPSSSSFCFIILAFALLHVPAFAFTTEELEEVPFSYTGQMGPANWGKLHPQFQECVVGKSQSPVDIITNQTELNPNLKPLSRNYRPGKSTLVNNGFNVGVRFDEDVGVLLVDGKNYSLKQMHWHSPSEHRIDGLQYPAELHLVHRTDDGNIAVVGILYQYGDADPLLSKLKNKLDELAKDVCASNEQSQVSLGTMDTKLIRRNTRRYYRYMGSLTTPPCSEKVAWHILGKIRDISKDQVAALKAPLNSDCKDNSRPLQPLNGRRIQLYDETPDGNAF